MSAHADIEQVRTELLTLKQVSDKGMGFIIPSYQRPYVWSNEDVIKLFDDIKAAFDVKEPHYFIGSVLCAVRKADLSYELIDGQQRTTTLMLMSLAFKATGISSPLAEMSVLGEGPRLTFEIRESVRNLLGSYAGLEKITRPGPEAIQNDAYLTHLDANLTVLKQKVEALKRDRQFDLGAFAEYIYTKVNWVNNIVPQTMDLNRLFSSMNTAGIQLEPVDLLKAKLLKKITSKKPLYNAIWQACEHTENYFERNLRQLFPTVNWNTLEYKDIKKYTPTLFVMEINSSQTECSGKTLYELIKDVNEGGVTENPQQADLVDTQAEIEDEMIYCRSIIGFELLLIHTLRIFCAQQGWPDLKPRIKAGNLMVCFEFLLQLEEADIKAFIELLWQVRYQFDTWVVKWVERDDREDSQLGLTYFSRSQSGNNYYINRTPKELGELVQLQAVRNFTGDRSAQYWLTALLGLLVKEPDMGDVQVLAKLEQLDNQMSLTTETQKEASFKIVIGEQPALKNWEMQTKYFANSIGTSFEHYWFQKLEYLLWKHGKKDRDEKLKKYRITSKNSVEHVHPQNEEHKNQLAQEYLDAFGNLVLLSPGENSSYGHQTVLKKKADFDSKPRYDSLKLKEMFELHTKSKNQWGPVEIETHQQHMLEVLATHYQERAMSKAI